MLGVSLQRREEGATAPCGKGWGSGVGRITAYRRSWRVYSQHSRVSLKNGAGGSFGEVATTLFRHVEFGRGECVGTSSPKRSTVTRGHLVIPCGGSVCTRHPHRVFAVRKGFTVRAGFTKNVEKYKKIACQKYEFTN